VRTNAHAKNEGLPALVSGYRSYRIKVADGRNAAQRQRAPVLAQVVRRLACVVPEVHIRNVANYQRVLVASRLEHERDREKETLLLFRYSHSSALHDT
jgi:hypothetical protein